MLVTTNPQQTLWERSSRRTDYQDLPEELYNPLGSMPAWTT
jgi:hypothetical protein